MFYFIKTGDFKKGNVLNTVMYQIVIIRFVVPCIDLKDMKTYSDSFELTIYLSTSLVAFIGFQDIANHNGVDIKLLLFNSIMCSLTVLISAKMIQTDETITIQALMEALYSPNAIIFFVAFFSIQVVKMRSYFADQYLIYLMFFRKYKMQQ